MQPHERPSGISVARQPVRVQQATTLVRQETRRYRRRVPRFGPAGLLLLAVIASDVAAQTPPAPCTPGPDTCCTDADCDDSTACTLDVCDAVSGTCEHAPETDTWCVEDNDPCTNDVCEAGACRHQALDERNACYPVDGSFLRSLGLISVVEGLEATVRAQVVTDAGPGDLQAQFLERLASVRARLQAVFRVLGGRAATPDAPPTPSDLAAGKAPILGRETIAQLRGRLALEQVGDAVIQAQSFISLVTLVQSRREIDTTVVRDLRKRGRSLLAGTKALKRDLRRLQRFKQVFAR